MELQTLNKTKEELRIEWSQLLLEQGTLGSELRVEKIAREQLGMRVPLPEQMMVIRP